MRYRKPTIEMLPMSMMELVEVADVKPSRLRAWGEGDELPGIGAGRITIKDVVLAAAMDAMEDAEVPISFAQCTYQMILFFLISACPDVVSAALAREVSSPAVPMQFPTSFLAHELSGITERRAKRYAVVEEGVFLRLATKRLASAVEDDLSFEVIDLQAIAESIAGRIERPLISVLFQPPGARKHAPKSVSAAA